MDIVRVSDGLGNQIFQYAFALKIQSETGHKVKFDTRFINNEDVVNKGNMIAGHNDIRNFQLDKFNILIPVASEKELMPWNYIKQFDSYENNVAYLSHMDLWPFCYAREGERDVFERHFFPTYYSGNFFHSLYYDDLREDLQKTFVLKEKITLCDDLSMALRKENSVAIHVRRGDYKYRILLEPTVFS